MKTFQDHYPDNLSHCYGCGANNAQGHRIKTFGKATKPSPVSRPSSTTPPCPLKATPNCSTYGHPKLLQAGRGDYGDSVVVAMRDAASFSR